MEDKKVKNITLKVDDMIKRFREFIDLAERYPDVDMTMRLGGSPRRAIVVTWKNA